MEHAVQAVQEFYRLNPDGPRPFALAGTRAMGGGYCHGQLPATTETALETRKPENALANALGTRPPEPSPEPKGRSRPQGLGSTSHGAEPRARSRPRNLGPASYSAEARAPEAPAERGGKEEWNYGKERPSSIA